MKLSTCTLLLALAGLLACCAPKATPPAAEPVATQPAEPLVWLQIDPIQCQGNPWEQGVEPNTAGENAKVREERLVRDYLMKSFSIKLVGFKQTQVYENVCDACSCPRGDRIEIQVAESAVETLALKAWKMAGASEE